MSVRNRGGYFRATWFELQIQPGTTFPPHSPEPEHRPSTNKRWMSDEAGTHGLKQEGPETPRKLYGIPVAPLGRPSLGTLQWWMLSHQPTYRRPLWPQRAAAEMAEEKKREKYAFLSDTFHFVPLGFETLGVWGSDATHWCPELKERFRKEPENYARRTF